MSSPDWPPAPHPRTLPAGEVHVWSAPLDFPPEQIAQIAKALAPDERARADRYLAPSARAQFVAARAALRSVLAAYLATEPGRVAFAAGPRGKPRLAGGEGLTFNVSHTAGLALIAVSAGAEVGVDVERVRPFENHRDLAARFFCPPEAAVIRALPPGRSEEAFFHCWTRKEAFLKATGLGIAHGLDRVEVTLLPEEPARVVALDGDAAPAAGWALAALAPAPGYVGALAVEGHGRRVCCWRWPG